jgi:hypothetical protein
MATTHFLKYYRVFKHETAVTEVLTNDFIPVKKFQFKGGQPIDSLRTNRDWQSTQFKYELPKDDMMFYGYISKIKAMEKAKAGALLHINKMIAEITLGIEKLKSYRSDHYQDLNVSLLDGNIRKLEQQMNIK